MLMVSGLLASFLGTQIIDGAITGLIALGVFPLIWIPFYRTLTEIEDLFAFAASVWVGRFRPGSVLVLCEAVDVVLSVAVLAVVLVAPGLAVPALIAYLFLASVLPLLVDLAEDFFLNDVAQVDKTAAIRGNVIIGTGTAIVGLAIGRSTGAFSSTEGVAIALVANIVASSIAVTLRFASRATFDPVHELDPADSETAFFSRLKKRLVPAEGSLVFEGGVLSPGVSAITAVAAGVVSTYILIWAAGSGSQAGARLGVSFLVVGIVSAAGPIVVGRILERRKERSGGLLVLFSGTALVGYAAALLVVVLASRFGVDRLWSLVGVVIAMASWTAFRFTLSTARQLEFSKDMFRRILGWSFSMSALGGMVATWTGYALGAATNPVPALLVALASTAAVIVVVLRGSATHQDQAQG